MPPPRLHTSFGALGDPGNGKANFKKLGGAVVQEIQTKKAANGIVKSAVENAIIQDLAHNITKSAVENATIPDLAHNMTHAAIENAKKHDGHDDVGNHSHGPEGNPSSKFHDTVNHVMQEQRVVNALSHSHQPGDAKVITTPRGAQLMQEANEMADPNLQYMKQTDEERDANYVITFKKLFGDLSDDPSYKTALENVTNTAQLHAFMKEHDTTVFDTVHDYVLNRIVSAGMPKEHADKLSDTITNHALDGSGVSIRVALEAAVEFMQSGNDAKTKSQMQDIYAKLALHKKIDDGRIAKIRDLKDQLKKMIEAGGEVGELRAEMAKLDEEIARLTAENEEHLNELRTMLDELSVLISVMNTVTQTLYHISKTGTEWMKGQEEFLVKVEESIDALNMASGHAQGVVDDAQQGVVDDTDELMVHPLDRGVNSDAAQQDSQNENQMVLPSKGTPSV